MAFDTRLDGDAAIAADVMMAAREAREHAMAATAYAAGLEAALSGLPRGFDIPAGCEDENGRLLFGELARYRAEIAPLLAGWPADHEVPEGCFDETGRLIKSPIGRREAA
jgi:hypothetical protein